MKIKSIQHPILGGPGIFHKTLKYFFWKMIANALKKAKNQNKKQNFILKIDF